MSDLSLAALAERLGVRVPSLYKHVAGLEAVRQAISVRAKADLADALLHAASGRARTDALVAVCHAYRSWAKAHPGRYESTLRAPQPDDPEDVAVSDRAVGVIFGTLAGYGLEGDAAIDATRMLRANLHGFVALEAAGGYKLPQSVDRSFDALVSGLDRSLSTWP
jgi:AcrR family transcriptional regulator